MESVSKGEAKQRAMGWRLGRQRIVFLSKNAILSFLLQNWGFIFYCQFKSEIFRAI